MSKAGRLVTNEEEAEMLSSVFVWVFYDSLFPHLSSARTARWALE